MSKVSGLHRVGLGVRDLVANEAFFRSRWAMEADGSVDDGTRRSYFRSRGLDHADLQLALSGDDGLDHVALRVDSEVELHELLESLAAQGHEPVEQPRPGRRADERLVAAVLDLDGNRIELVVPSATAAAAAQSPRHLGHVVLWTPQVEAQERFYALLGFSVSDRTHIGMSFLRVNTDHHSLALAASKQGRRGLQHAAFDVGTIDDVMREYGRLRDAGEPCIWGVGRHGPGNNVFAYYKDPAGHVVEFYGDMEKVPDATVIEPRFWGPEHKGDIWGVAGGPPQQFRD